MPTTNVVWWYPMETKIIFHNLKCGLKKVKVLYIPSFKEMQDKCVVPEALVYDVIQQTLALMFAARNGKVVDMTNNQNPNAVMETELDTTFKNLKTNP